MSGFFGVNDTGNFNLWSEEPEFVRNQRVPQNRFGLWSKTRGKTETTFLNGHHFHKTAQLFPCSWIDHPIDAPLQVESQWFSPILPNHDRESSLPIQLIVFRLRNSGASNIDAALMLSWNCGWSDTGENVAFDMQHDNLCITGALGKPESQNRQGIALPDLHSDGIFLQSVEPWTAIGDQNEEADIWADFAEDGELDPRVVKHNGQGAAAWVKFEIEPDEIKEIPFVIAWHFPYYQKGPFAGELKFYSQFLGRFRPDNSIVWLAEQAYQNFGTEAAAYRHWMRQIQDWHESIQRERDPVLSAEAINLLGALRQMELYRKSDGDLKQGNLTGQNLSELKRLLHHPNDPLKHWPDVHNFVHRLITL